MNRPLRVKRKRIPFFLIIYAICEKMRLICVEKLAAKAEQI